MCRLVGFSGPVLQDLSYPLLTAPNALRNQSRCDTQSGKPNDAGWGFGFWDDSNPEIVKHPTAAAEDPVFEITAQRACRRMIAHIRRASTGGIAPENTHPFGFENRLVFAHNGSIDRFDSIRHQAVSELPADFRPRITGRTDSEYILYLFLSELFAIDQPETENIRSFQTALERTIIRCRQWAAQAAGDDPPELNFMFLTKHFLISTKVLYWLGFYKVGGGTLITSEPLASGDGWQPLDENTMIAVRRDGRHEIINLHL